MGAPGRVKQDSRSDGRSTARGGKRGPTGGKRCGSGLWGNRWRAGSRRRRRDDDCGAGAGVSAGVVPAAASRCQDEGGELRCQTGCHTSPPSLSGARAGFRRRHARAEGCRRGAVAGKLLGNRGEPSCRRRGGCRLRKMGWTSRATFRRLREDLPNPAGGMADEVHLRRGWEPPRDARDCKNEHMETCRDIRKRHR